MKKTIVCLTLVLLLFSLSVSYSRAINRQVLSNAQKKQVLVLQSYEPEMKWVQNIEEGIRKVFSDQDDVYLYMDFMDVKRNPSEAYLQKMYDLYQYKYKDRRFAAIITCDDTAYQFLRSYQHELFFDAPVIFCGVNFFDEKELKNFPLFTGVEEKIDIEHTLQIALKNHPSAKQVVVINDLTEVGMENKQRIIETIPKFSERAKFIFLEDMTMDEVLMRVQQLDSDSIVLMMSFNKDKNNQAFTYEESLDLVADKTKVPIYGVWDMYLGHGIVGGMITSGYWQGEKVAQITQRILAGESPTNIPVIRDGSANRYMFDSQQLKLFHISEASLPIGSIVVNKSASFYEKYKLLVWITSSVIALLTIVIMGLYIYILRKKRLARELHTHATTDAMTGIFNRRTGLEILANQMMVANHTGLMLSICFVDLNDLKKINDTYGHQAGDQMLKLVCEAIQNSIRKSDIVCRLGGDEFLIIFPGCDRQRATVIGDKINEKLICYQEQKIFPTSITISQGFSEYIPNCQVSLDDFIKQADDEMYRNKKAIKQKMMLLENKVRTNIDVKEK